MLGREDSYYEAPPVSVNMAVRTFIPTQQVPLSIVFRFKFCPVLAVFSVLVPLVAIGTVFSRRVITSLYILCALGFIAVAESILLYLALFSPLLSIIQQMGSGAG